MHIGPVRADLILTGRPWDSMDGLVRLVGIGPAQVEDIKAQGWACVR